MSNEINAEYLVKLGAQLVLKHGVSRANLIANEVDRIADSIAATPQDLREETLTILSKIIESALNDQRSAVPVSGATAAKAAVVTDIGIGSSALLGRLSANTRPLGKHAAEEIVTAITRRRGLREDWLSISEENRRDIEAEFASIIAVLLESFVQHASSDQSSNSTPDLRSAPEAPPSCSHSAE